MKPTNYHLFDFLDFDTELSRNESLWKAYKPTAVYEKEGAVRNYIRDLMKHRDMKCVLR